MTRRSHVRPIGPDPATPSGRDSGVQLPPLADTSIVPRCFIDRKPKLDWVWNDLKQALVDLYRYEVDLFIYDVGERCLVANLAKHFWRHVLGKHRDLNESPKWDVEYNRHGQSQDPKILYSQNSGIDVKHCRTPDLVLHRRGTDAQNLCVIEVKKHHKRSFDDPSPDNQSKDIEVLEKTTAPEGAFRYRTGLLLILKPHKIEMLSFPERTWHSFAPPAPSETPN
jgi:hypothetical protein